LGVAILSHHFRQSANQFFKNYFSNVPPSETETSLVEIRITRMSFLMGADSLHRQTKTFRNTFESFSQSPKKTLVCFSLFARAQANAHVHFERERKKHMDRKGGTRECSKEVLKKNPLIILSVNRASPADGSATSPSRRSVRGRSARHLLINYGRGLITSHF
jgi:hypothetical protein